MEATQETGAVQQEVQQKEKKPVWKLVLRGILIGLAVLALIISMIVGLVLTIVLNNKFRTNKVNNVDLGMTREQVERKFGKPQEEIEGVLYWYNGSYKRWVKKIHKYEDKIEKLDGSDPEKEQDLLEKIEKLEEKRLNKVHHRIAVRFSDDKVISVTLEKKIKDSDTEPRVHEDVEKVKFIPKRMSLLAHPNMPQNESGMPMGARVYYANGDYCMEYVAFVDADKIKYYEPGIYSDISCTNSFGTFKTSVEVDDKIQKGATQLLQFSDTVFGFLTALEEGSLEEDEFPDYSLTVLGEGVADGDRIRDALLSYAGYVKQVDFTEGITEITGDPFADLTMLETVTLCDTLVHASDEVIDFVAPENGPLYIGTIFWGYYGDMKELAESDYTVTIREGTTRIQDGAFRNKTNLKNVVIPETVEYIGKDAFGGCTSLTSITLPAAVTTIESYAFRDCTGLTSLTIPAGVTSISVGTFSGCTNLATVNLPSKLKSIGDFAFFECAAYTAPSLSGVTIGEHAFWGTKAP